MLGSTEDVIASLNGKINRLIGFLSENIASEDVKKSLAELCEKRDALIRLKNDEKNQQTSKNIFLTQIRDLSHIWDRLDFEKQRAVIVSLIKKIVITYDKIDIYYNFEDLAE